MGDITIDLFPNQAPKTVANFVELATGAKEWLDPNISEKVKTNLYDGTIFHRVIPGFMIQGGDPLGSGMGGPGYNFADEFHGELNFTACTGLSFAPVLTAAIASITFWLAASFTSPKIECLRFSQAVAATVIKNCDPLVFGPAFAIASRYGLSKFNSP